MATTVVIARPFRRAIKEIRRAIADAELEIAAQFEARRTLRDRWSGKRTRLLLVDSPLSDLEALAFGASAAVFLPLHVLVSGDGETTRVSWTNTAGLLHARLPPGAAAPLHRLHARMAWAIASLGA